MLDRNDGDITVSQVGGFYLRIIGEVEGLSDGKKDVVFPCMRVVYSMQVGSDITATVHLPVGRSVLDPENVIDPTKLLQAIQQKDTKGAYGLIRCSLYEAPSADHEEEIALMDGYILDGNLNYTSAGGNGLTVCLTLGGKTSPLLAAPTSAYNDACLDKVMDTITSNMSLSNQTPENTARMFLGQKLCLDMYKVETNGWNLIDRLSNAVATVRRVGSYNNNGDNVGEWHKEDRDPDVDAAFGSAIKLKPGFGSLVEEAFSGEVFIDVAGGMGAASILDGIRQMASAHDHMLQLVPRWSFAKENDFRVEIVPDLFSVSNTYGGGPIIVDAHLIRDVTIRHDTSQAINAPDIVLVEFDETPAFLGGMPNGAIGVIGAAAMNKELDAKLRDIKGKDPAATAAACELYKTRTVKAPAWLSMMIPGTGAVDDDKRKKVAKNRVEGSPENSEDELVAENLNNSTEAADSTGITNGDANDEALERLRKRANDIARAILLTRFMVHDMVNISLTPAIRFGLHDYWFENRLGDQVKLEIDTKGVGDMKLRLKGTLDSIYVDYVNYDGSTSFDYAIGLKRVVLEDVDTSMLEQTHPLYDISDLN